MYHQPSTNITDATRAAAYGLSLSIQHPDKYVTVVNDFGACYFITDRLATQAPSDSPSPVYWLNGKARPFTNAQKIADQNATPALS